MKTQVERRFKILPNTWNGRFAFAKSMTGDLRYGLESTSMRDGKHLYPFMGLDVQLDDEVIVTARIESGEA